MVQAMRHPVYGEFIGRSSPSMMGNKRKGERDTFAKILKICFSDTDLFSRYEPIKSMKTSKSDLRDVIFFRRLLPVSRIPHQKSISKRDKHLVHL
jgi:hypothetical protein